MKNIKVPELLTSDEISTILKVKPRQFKERICLHPNFPRPINQAVMRSAKRWKQAEVFNWIEKGGR